MLQQLRPALVSVLVFTILTGLLFPFAITGIAQLVFPKQARGSLMEQNGQVDPGNCDGIKDLAAAYRKENGLPDNAPIPADAVTRSASGLDPHISPANAQLQAARVAQARRLSEEQVRRLVMENTEGRQFGFLGEPRVNVLRLNLALDKASPWH